MSNIDKKISEFINEHHVLTLATCLNDQPWSSNCFYAYIEEENMFVITSDMETRHISEITQNNKISGSIVLETSIIGKIQGIQFSGIIYKPNVDMIKIANKAYLLKFPFAMLMKTVLWIVEPDFIKMTDNRLGFGKKIIWTKSEENNAKI